MSREHDTFFISFDEPAPAVITPYRFFCFTGHFLSVKRKDCENAVTQAGGIVKSHINNVVNYLVIGQGLYEQMNRPMKSLNSKMTDVLAIRETGSKIAIISEEHFSNQLLNSKAIKPMNHILINSFRFPDINYEVDLLDLKCTCLNFQEDRSGYPIDDPRRLCKHLTKALFENSYIPSSLKEHVEKIAIAALYKFGTPGWGNSINS